MKFEKTGSTKVTPKRASFLKSAEQMVEERAEVTIDRDDPDIRRMEAEAEERRRIMESEIRTRQRANVLLSMEVRRQASPSERLNLNTPEEAPFRLRWCDDTYRKRIGMDIWRPVTAEEFESLRQYVNVDQVEVKEDGRVYAGGLFLAMAPTSKVEERTALHYQRSQRNLKAAAMGQMALAGAKPGSSAGESMEELARRANAGLGEGDELIRFTGKLRDDKL